MIPYTKTLQSIILLRAIAPLLPAAETAAPDDAMAAAAKDLPRIAFIRRNGYGMRGTNATMFARRTGRGSAIRLLDPSAPGAAPETIFATREGFILDMNPSYDGKKLVFSCKEQNDRPFHVWEIRTDGAGLRQITRGDCHDVSPVYYPDGRIVFTSSRVKSFSLCQNYLACALHICDGDGRNLRRFDFTTLCSLSPAVLGDGSILFTRWEYQDKNIFCWEGLWTIRPDGTNLALYHGNTLTIPNAVYGAEEIPGTGHAVTVMAAHHHPPLGDIAVVDRTRGVENPAGMRQITFATNYRVTTGRNWRDANWRPGDRFHRRSFTDPFPVDETYSLVSDGRTGRYRVSLLRHADGAVLPLHTADEGFSPVPLAPRPLPHAIPGDCPQEKGFGTFFVQDVYQGLLRQGVTRGQVQRLRIMSQVPKKYNTEGPRYHDHYPVVGHGNYYVKHNHGTVPVDESGAAYFKAPSNTEIYFQALDEKGREIIRMGSVTQITTGQRASCVGCHENRLESPAVPKANFARLDRPPDEITPPPVGAGPVDYAAHVQPVLDRYCAGCHAGPRPPKGVNLTGDKTRFYSVSYESLVFKNYVDYYYIHDGPTGNFPALSTGSWTSTLTRLLEGGHKKVTGYRQPDRESLKTIYCWIDSNVCYYGTWEMSRPHSRGGRDATTIPAATGRPKPAPWVKKLARACKTYRVRIKTDDINYTNPSHSPGLLRLLATSAGGGAPDRKARFRSKDAPGYRVLLRILAEARDTLLTYPRMDMAGGKAVAQERDFGKVY